MKVTYRNRAGLAYRHVFLLGGGGTTIFASFTLTYLGTLYPRLEALTIFLEALRSLTVATLLVNLLCVFHIFSFDDLRLESFDILL